MNYNQCVPNDIKISNIPFFQVVTGANMAGKSTWLRTVGTNLLLAMMGSVVNAKAFKFAPVNIATSLHTADSLMKNESYFYSELLRLQEIINLMHEGKPVFVLLDEILKGTNSGDKEAGSIALLKQLIDLKSYGIIATHDLNLAKITDQYQQFTENCRFEAEIIDDKLFFDYKIKEGVAQNFNATFLMKKMGITL
jgi:DNA mismatch repair ATPase MutS